MNTIILKNFITLPCIFIERNLNRYLLPCSASQHYKWEATVPGLVAFLLSLYPIEVLPEFSLAFFKPPLLPSEFIPLSLSFYILFKRF